MSEPLNMRGMPYVPLDPQWIAESPAFHSSNPQVVRACLNLLTYAWAAVPAGTVPAGFKALASITGLSEQDLGESHDDLFQGWELIDGRMRFLPMYAVCDRVSARYGDVLSKLADQGVAVMQAPEEFELVAEEVAPQTKGRTKLPNTWKVSPDLMVWLRSKDYTAPEDIEFVTEKFMSHFRATGELRSRWDDSFRNFVLKENVMNLPSRRLRPLQSGAQGSSRANRFGSAGVAAQAHNGSVLAAAAERAGLREAHCG